MPRIIEVADSSRSIIQRMNNTNNIQPLCYPLNAIIYKIESDSIRSPREGTLWMLRFLSIWPGLEITILSARGEKRISVEKINCLF